MSNSIFNIVEVTNEQVVLKVTADDNLAIARHPYISGTFDYITVTRGANHILTIIYKDGHTWSFNWGINGYTLISDNMEMLRQKICEFIEEQGILLELTDSNIHSASIFFNSNYKKWELCLNHSVCHFSKTAKSFDEMKEEAKLFVNVEKWVPATAQTGIRIYNAQGRITLAEHRKENNDDE